jgi:DNA replication initiation complex subunit (GINS family)
VAVQDTTAPVPVCPADEVLVLDGACQASGAYVATGMDICSDVAAVQHLFEFGAPGSQGFTYTLVDGSGNASSCAQTVSAIDTAAPAITCPAVQTLECTSPAGADAVVRAAATDNCGVASLDDADGTYGLGTTPVVLGAVDPSGNRTSCETSVTVQDTTAPAPACPADETLVLDGACQAAGTYTATGADVCSDVAAVSHTFEFGVASSQRFTYTLADGSGNTASCAQTVSAIDTTEPEITCQAAQTLVCTGYDGAFAAVGATATDNCGVAEVGEGDGIYGLGTTPVTLTATDTSGLSVSCTTTVTVEDTTAPTLVCPADQVLVLDGACQAAGTYTATGTDVCSDVAAVSHVFEFGAPGSQGFTYTLVDGSGNASVCAQSVSAIDTAAPAIECPAPQTLECTSPAGAEAVVQATATDNCAVATLDDADGTYGLGTTPVVLGAVDPSGNGTTCETSVTVQDTTKPVVTCAGDTQECTGALTQATPAGAATDVCDDSLVLTSTEQAEGYALGETDVVYTATDASGNSETCTAEAPAGRMSQAKGAISPSTPAARAAMGMALCATT